MTTNANKSMEATEAATSEGRIDAKAVDAQAVAPRPPVLTLGRVVRYITPQGTERPAIVTLIRESGLVDLTVFNSEGAVPAVGVEEDPDREEEGTWHWPDWV